MKNNVNKMLKSDKIVWEDHHEKVISVLKKTCKVNERAWLL